MSAAQSHDHVKKLVTLAMLSAIAYLVMFMFRIPIVLFLKYDPKDTIIAIAGFRHELSGFSLKYNGQIGYSVRPSERGKGYACQMLSLLLKEAGNLGYKRVLVCCNKANVRSAKVIQKCGGVLENEVVHEFSPVGRPDIIQRYWIETLMQ